AGVRDPDPAVGDRPAVEDVVALRTRLERGDAPDQRHGEVEVPAYMTFTARSRPTVFRSIARPATWSRRRVRSRACTRHRTAGTAASATRDRRAGLQSPRRRHVRPTYSGPIRRARCCGPWSCAPVQA